MFFLFYAPRPVGVTIEQIIYFNFKPFCLGTIVSI